MGKKISDVKVGDIVFFRKNYSLSDCKKAPVVDIFLFKVDRVTAKRATATRARWVPSKITFSREHGAIIGDSTLPHVSHASEEIIAEHDFQCSEFDKWMSARKRLSDMSRDGFRMKFDLTANQITALADAWEQIKNMES